jgi:ribosomal protein L15E
MKKISNLSKELVSLEKAQKLGYKKWQGVNNVKERIEKIQEELVTLREVADRDVDYQD